MLCSLSRPELYMLCGQQNLISDQPVEPSQISNENLMMTPSRKIVGLKPPALSPITISRSQPRHWVPAQSAVSPRQLHPPRTLPLGSAPLAGPHCAPP